MIILTKGSRLLKCLSLGLMILSGTAVPALGQDQDQELPVVKAGALPLYPIMARAARIEGTVKIRVTTDGKKVSSLDTESGAAMLVKAAKENIQTWEFLEHKPTTFITVFVYRFEEPAQCYYSNDSVTLRLPLDVRISVNGLMTCDPSTTTTKVIAPKPKS
jgi:hypothetical protein